MHIIKIKVVIRIWRCIMFISYNLEAFGEKLKEYMENH